MLRAQLEMSQVRQEIDRRIQEKEEEFEHSRKNHQRALESMQASLEAEARAKEEALRIKKKNEADINEVTFLSSSFIPPLLALIFVYLSDGDCA